MGAMSKKIDAALNDLKEALDKHAAVVGDRHVSLKRAQRASAKVTAAASAYAEAVYAKSKLTSPFDDVLQPGLESSTIESLAAERDAIAKNLTGPVPIQNYSSGSQAAHVAIEPADDEAPAPETS